MPYQPNAFQRILEPIDRRIFGDIVAAHDGNRGVGNGPWAWTCQRHLKALLFAQLAGLNSLREVVEALSARPEALYHLDLRLPKRSTLSDAAVARPAAVFRDLGRHLMALAGRRLRREGEAVIELIDASPIPLRDARFLWPESDSRVRGLKLFVRYDPARQCPTFFDLGSPKISDTTLGRALPLAAGTTYVFDKGFTDYAWWCDIIDAGAFFVTRLKKNACRRAVAERAVGRVAPVLADNTLKLGHKKPRGGADNPLHDVTLREVVVERDGKEPLRLVTNDFARSAAEIAQLYKERWQVELFFKWLKQNLKVKSFLGRSENAVRIQLYVALIAFLLLALLKDGYANTHKGSIKNLRDRLKVALLHPIDLTGRAKPPPTSPAMREPTPQMKLAFP